MRLLEIAFKFIYWYLHCFIFLPRDIDNTEKYRARQLKEVLHDLGSVFIKFGQMLAMRPDFVPKEYCKELYQFLEDVAPFPEEEVAQVLQAEFHKKPEEIFAKFERSPFASASFAQVHKAKTFDGNTVAVKVQRPNMLKIVQRDITLMKSLAKIVDTLLRTTTKIHTIVEEFETWTYEELDYSHEMKATEEFHNLLKETEDNITAPRIYCKLCTDRILTMEHIDGISLGKIISGYRNKDRELIKAVEEKGFSGSHAAFQIMKHFLESAHLRGRFHADPHPANILFTQGDNLVYIDFGITGKLKRKERISIMRYTRSVLLGDFENSFDALMDMCDISNVKDFKKFKAEYFQNLDQLKKALDEPNFFESQKLTTPIFQNALRLIRRYNIDIPIDIVRYLKAYETIEGLLFELDPGLETNYIKEEFQTVAIQNLIRELPDVIKDKKAGILMTLLNAVEKEMVR